ncbi:hypothetical protein GP486_008811 [Trichoglossum hirsutum]|uniref:Uncharacterized protein n=1 Tax=Trichoglossum hirsutum TaxID=265104 RepID=A0A9P8I378_9PEZI|nr:hypothetical protein GP486_008811 [Trichoglossum hirsutum]
MNIVDKIKAWRSKRHPKAVISHSCLSKLPAHLQSHFVEVDDEPTAQVAYGSQPDTFTMAMIAADITDGALDAMVIGNQQDDFQGFGGGNTGGGGAGGDWVPDPPQPQDYTPDPTPDPVSDTVDSGSWDSGNSDN